MGGSRHDFKGGGGELSSHSSTQLADDSIMITGPTRNIGWQLDNTDSPSPNVDIRTTKINQNLH